MQKAPIGGNFVSAQAKYYLESKLNVDLTPKQLIKSRNPVDSSIPPIYEKKALSGITKSYEEYATEVAYTIWLLFIFSKHF